MALALALAGVNVSATRFEDGSALASLTLAGHAVTLAVDAFDSPGDSVRLVYR